MKEHNYDCPPVLRYSNGIKLKRFTPEDWGTFEGAERITKMKREPQEPYIGYVKISSILEQIIIEKLDLEEDSLENKMCTIILDNTGLSFYLNYDDGYSQIFWRANADNYTSGDSWMKHVVKNPLNYHNSYDFELI